MRMKKGFPGSVAAVATAMAVFVCSGVLATSGEELEGLGLFATFAEQESEGEGGTSAEQTPAHVAVDEKMAEKQAAYRMTIVDHDDDERSGRQQSGLTGLAGMDAITDSETVSKETESIVEEEIESETESVQETETDPETEIESATESESIPESESEIPAESSETEPATEVIVPTETETETEYQTESIAETETESASETETEATLPEPETQVKPPKPEGPGPAGPEDKKPEVTDPGQDGPEANKPEPQVLGPVLGEPKNYIELVGESLLGIMTPNPNALAGESMNVRSGPGTDYPVIGKMYKGSAGQCIQTEGDWYHIHSGNVDGWINKTLVISGYEAARVLKENNFGYLSARVTTETLNIRSTPELGDNLLGQVAGGSYVVVNDLTPDGWCNITNEAGVTGFVSKGFLSCHYVLKNAVTLEEEAAYLAEQARIARDNATAQAIYASAATGGCTRNPVILSYDDAYLIGCVCEMEAGYVDYSIRLAIANIIINRYLSGIWGYSIPGVVYAPGQFNGASTAYTPSASTMQAVYDALGGHNNAGGYMYYCTIPAMERVNHGEGTILGPMFMYEPGWL